MLRRLIGLAAFAAVAAAAADDEAGSESEFAAAAEREFADLTENADAVFDSLTFSIDAYRGQFRKLQQASSVAPTLAPSIQRGVAGLAKTEGLCSDLVDTYSTLTALFDTFATVKDKIQSSCNTAKDIADACDQVVTVNEVSSSAHPILIPLKPLPYVGKVVGMMADTAKKVADGTKTAAKCITYIRKLNVRKYVKQCTTLTKKMEDLKKKVAMVFADVEIAKVRENAAAPQELPACCYALPGLVTDFMGVRRSCGARASRKRQRARHW